MRSATGLWTTAFFAFAFCAQAAGFEMTMFGHKVEIVGEMPETQLKIDGKDVWKDAIVAIDEVAVVGTTPVMIGDSSGGGNACDSMPFVVSFPADAGPKLDGPLDGCATVHVENRGQDVLFFENPIPGRDADRWTWTPGQGFKKIDSVAFKPDDGKGWAQLAAEAPRHPSGIFSFGEIATQIYDLLGADKAQYEQSITGVGSGSLDGTMYLGMACTSHMCTEEEALLAADIPQKKVYLAWKPMNAKIVVRPPVKEWPAQARTALKDWAAKWK